MIDVVPVPMVAFPVEKLPVKAVRFTLLPEQIGLGEAVTVVIAGGGVTVNTAEAVATQPCPASVAVTVYVYEPPSVGVTFTDWPDTEPEIPLPVEGELLQA
jgi:hypothetical protein